MFKEKSFGLQMDLGRLIEGKVVARPNRFVGIVDIEGKEITSHVADPGRLEELIFPGNSVMVRDAQNLSMRKTTHDLVLASYEEKVWVSVNTLYPTRLFGEALRRRLIPEFRDYTGIRPEYTLRGDDEGMDEGKKPPIRSRIDFLLNGSIRAPALVEVKSVNLCIGNTGFFPDAPTARGARHLKELTAALKKGYASYGVFIAQRNDILRVSPNKETDPMFYDAMKKAKDCGVRFLAYGCTVGPFLNPRYITLGVKSLPVIVD